MKRARTVKIILLALSLFVAAGIQTAVAEISLSPGWYVGGTQTDEQFAFINSAGDVNGDGYDDVLVNAYLYDNGQTDEGRVYAFYGSAAGLSMTPNWIVESNTEAARLGNGNINVAGDLNKDGYDDVIISTTGGNDTGKVSAYYGSANGLSSTPAWTVTGDQVGASFGKASIAGDVNGDGYLDIIVGAEMYNNGLSSAGRVYIYYGSAAGLSTTPNLIIEGNQAGGRLGSSLSPAGDVNGDGFDDIIVGAYYYNNGVPNEGASFVYYGSATGLKITPAWTFSTGQEWASVGWVNKVGDVNNDGYDDVIIGSPWYDGQRGKVWLFLGSATGLSTTPHWTAQGENSYCHFGWPSGSADVNGDGAKDIYIGAHTYPNGERKGRAYVYYGTCDATCWKNAYDRVKAELDDCRNPTTTTTVPPTLIEMSSLKAIPANEKVKLEWKTEAEIDNAGFNVWRAEGFTKISPALIPAQGSPTEGAEYDFVDDLVFNGKQYIYLIEDVDNGGISTFHGPVKATPRMILGR